MKKILLTLTVLFASLSSFAQGEGELIADEVTVAVNDLYGVFIKNYPDSAIARVNKGEKLTVKYESDNLDVVQPYGNLFHAVGLGTCNVTFRLSPVWPGTQNAFDERYELMTKTIKVTVVEKEPMVMPTFDLSWGTKRSDVIARNEKWGNTVITDHYYSHFPDKIADEPEVFAQNEVFLNPGNFDAPVTFYQFNNDDELIATTVLFAGNTKVTSTSGYIYKWLQGKGFEYAVPEPPYWNLVLKYEGVITKSSWLKVIVDNVWFCGVMFEYAGVDTAIDEITDEDVQFNLFTEGTTININAPEYAGRNVTISDLSGKVVASSKIMTVGNIFNVPGNGMYIVKIDGVKSVKVLMR